MIHVWRNGELVTLSPEDEAQAHALSPTAEDLRAAAIEATKAEARRRIEQLSGDANNRERLLRWSVQIADLRNTDYPYPATLPGQWAARESAMRASGQQIEAIAAASNTIEADIATLVDDVSVIEAWIAAMPSDERWPA